MDRNVLANSTNAVSSCLSCLSAAASHPCPSKGQHNLMYAYVPVGPTFHLCSYPTSQTIENNMSTCLEIGLCQEIIISWSHTLSSACFEGEHWWCQGYVYHKLMCCLLSFLLGYLPLPLSILHWPVSQSGYWIKRKQKSESIPTMAWLWLY